MCGRYNLTRNPRSWRLTRPVRATLQAPFQPRYNIAPGQAVPVFRDGGDTLELIEMTWGYVPHYATDDKPKAQPINARTETVFDTPYFRGSIQQRRCLVPATGYYEWQVTETGKQPFHIHLPHGKPFLMAGVWDYQGGDPARPTVAILTGPASGPLAEIHDRIPIIIPRKLVAQWFEQPDNRLLMSAGTSVFEAEPISTRINNARNEGADVLKTIKSESR